MSKLVETSPIEGLKVYGQQMVDYTVEGDAHLAFDKAMAIAAFREAVAIETETMAYGDVLQMRQKKLEELGDCVSELSRIITAMDADESDDFWPEGAYDPSLRTLKAKLEKYGVTLNITDDTVITLPVCYVEYGDAEKAKANAEYAMDNEDNDLQQDMVTYEGLISKRDESYNTASKIIKKYNNTAKSIINMIGQ